VLARKRPARGKLKTKTKLKGKLMLYTIAVYLIILWLLGMVSGVTIGSFIHILLVIAVIMILVKPHRRRRVALTGC
jgi:predicted membrane metal-binding protein